MISEQYWVVMLSFFKSRSFFIYLTAIITPVIAWIVLFTLAQNTTNSFDPSPRIQSFVQNPGQKIPQETLTSPAWPLAWIHVVGLQGKLFVLQNKTNNAPTTSLPPDAIPLAEYKTRAQELILLVEAQGPHLASELYQFLKDQDLLKRVLVLAVSDGFLKDVRYYNAELPLGAGQAYLIRFRALQTLGLENFLVINMSGLWLRPEIFTSDTEQLTNTFVQKHVPVFIGPTSESEISSLPKNANFLMEAENTPSP